MMRRVLLTARPLCELWPFFVLWCLTLLWCEHFAFRAFASWCSWPEPAGEGDQHRILLVSDPQLTDWTSYKWLIRIKGTMHGRLLLALYSHLCDAYIRRVWRAILAAQQRWDLAVFLGDMFDGGRYADEQQWPELLRRFDAMFGVRDAPKALFAVGNHDSNMCTNCTVDQTFRHGVPDALRKLPLGQPNLEPLVWHAAAVLERHEQAFGKTNQVLNLGEFRVVMVDTVSLSQMVNARRNATLQFVEETSMGTTEHRPTILVSHIPLWRPLDQRKPTQDCPHGLPEATYYDFQNALSTQLSLLLIEKIQPSVILSGDHHHLCVYEHRWHASMFQSTVPPIRETTLPTISFLQGELWPGYGLLTLRGKSFGVTTCYIPSYLFSLLIYCGMALAGAATVIARCRRTKKTPVSTRSMLTCSATPGFYRLLAKQCCLFSAWFLVTLIGIHTFFSM